MFFRTAFLIFVALTFSWNGWAGVEQISELEFQQLATELAGKVNLFHEVWKQDPKAEIYGGSSRDYLFWLKRQFLECKNREQAQRAIQKLKNLPLIDIRDFIVAESDVDILSSRPIRVLATQYGVRAIDVHSAEVLFNPATEEGKNELTQGYIPAEKIRLGHEGILPNPFFGNGASEIYSGKVTVHFTDPKVFETSSYAMRKENHPILLALRYIRLLGRQLLQLSWQGISRRGQAPGNRSGFQAGSRKRNQTDLGWKCPEALFRAISLQELVQRHPPKDDSLKHQSHGRAHAVERIQSGSTGASL